MGPSGTLSATGLWPYRNKRYAHQAATVAALPQEGNLRFRGLRAYASSGLREGPPNPCPVPALWL